MQMEGRRLRPVPSSKEVENLKDIYHSLTPGRLAGTRPLKAATDGGYAALPEKTEIPSFLIELRYFCFAGVFFFSKKVDVKKFF